MMTYLLLQPELIQNANLAICFALLLLQACLFTVNVGLKYLFKTFDLIQFILFNHFSWRLYCIAIKAEKYTKYCNCEPLIEKPYIKYNNSQIEMVNQMLDLVADQSSAANSTYASKFRKSKIYKGKLAADFFDGPPKINRGT